MMKSYKYSEILEYLGSFKPDINLKVVKDKQIYSVERSTYMFDFDYLAYGLLQKAFVYKFLNGEYGIAVTPFNIKKKLFRSKYSLFQGISELHIKDISELIDYLGILNRFDIIDLYFKDQIKVV